MKTTSKKPTVISMALGLAFGMTVAYTSAHAYDIDYEISSAYDSAVNDTFTSMPPSVRVGGYKTKMTLDEAYHEYQNQEVIAFEANLGELEQTEMAAFETSERSVLPDVSPWQLEGGLD